MKRVTRALEGFREVYEVDFDPRTGYFNIGYQAPQPLGKQLQSAAESMVIASEARKVLGDIGDVTRGYKH